MCVCVTESDGSVGTDSNETLTPLLEEVRSDIKCASGQNADPRVQVHNTLKTTSHFSILDVRSEEHQHAEQQWGKKKKKKGAELEQYFTFPLSLIRNLKTGTEAWSACCHRDASC